MTPHGLHAWCVRQCRLCAPADSLGASARVWAGAIALWLIAHFRPDNKGGLVALRG